MRKLERLGLAEPLGPARWRLSERAEPTPRMLGKRNDIIKRVHRGLADQRIERTVSDFALHDGDARQVMGRLVAYGLDDELKENVGRPAAARVRRPGPHHAAEIYRLRRSDQRARCLDASADLISS
jgi:type IV secretory pathway VirD2 relaxase